MPGTDLPTARECPQCNTVMKPFWVQSRNPEKDVELDRCHGCGGVWFDAGELEITTGRSVVKSNRPCERYCPRCSIPLLNAELQSGVAVETCRSCNGTYLDTRDMDTVTRHKPRKPPADVTFVCQVCGQRKIFATAVTTTAGVACGDCAAKAQAAEKGSMFGAFVSWLRGD